MPNIVIQVKLDLENTLESIGAPKLNQELSSVLEGQILNIANANHKIRHLVREYYPKFAFFSYFR